MFLLVSLATAASAQHYGPYIGGYAGGTVVSEARSTNDQGDFGIRFKPSLSGSAVLGWELEPDNSLGEGRIELEYRHQSNQIDRVKFSEGNFSGSGTVDADFLLFNMYGVLHDSSSTLAPYAGAGFGAARLAASSLMVAGQPLASGSATVFAFQLGAGLDVALTRRLNLDLGYRFVGTSPATFTEPSGKKFDMDYFSHNAVLGLRFGF